MGKQTVGKYIVDSLASFGVDKIFSVPGESFLPVMDACYDGQVDLVVTRHEEGAAIAAQVYAAATGQIGVCAVTRAVGLGHAFIGVHIARQDSIPLLVLVGQVPRKFQGREAFQEIDIPVSMAPVAKWAVELRDPNRTAEVLTRAAYMAQVGRPGPVVVALPEDVLYETIDAAIPQLRIPEGSSPNPDSLARAGAMLAEAKHPVILAGSGAFGARQDLIELAERLEAPVLSAFRRFDVFPNHHRLYAGTSSIGTLPLVEKTLEDCDVLLVLGSRLSEMTSQRYTYPLAATEVIQVDTDPESIAVGRSEIDVPIVADAKVFAQALLRDLTARNLPDADQQAAHRAWAAQRHQALLNVSTIGEKREYGVDYLDVMETFRNVLPADAVMVTDAGNFSGWYTRFHRFQEPTTHFGPTSGAMGYAVPAAFGAKLADPSRPVVAMVGDGGFLMTASELATAVQHGAPIIVTVFDNGMYGTMKMHQLRRFPGREVGISLDNPDFAEVGRALGCNGYRITQRSQLDKAYREALASERPSVIVIESHPEQISAWRGIAPQ